jgi:TolB-like protein
MWFEPILDVFNLIKEDVMRKLGVLLVFSLNAVFCFAQTAISLDAAINDCTQYLKRELPQRTRVAIMPVNAKTDEFSAYITEKLSASLVNDRYLTVVERSDRALKAAEMEIFYQMSTMAVSDETAASLGKQFGAQMILFGNIVRQGNAFRLTVRVLDVETSQLQGHWETEAIRTDENLIKLATPVINATVDYRGSNLQEEDKTTLFDGLLLALQDGDVPVTLVPDWVIAEGEDRYVFTISVRMNQRGSPQSPIPLITGDITVGFSRNGNSIRQTSRQSISEMDIEMFMRRGGESIRGNRAFFQGLNEALAQQ